MLRQPDGVRVYGMRDAVYMQGAASLVLNRDISVTWYELRVEPCSYSRHFELYGLAALSPGMFRNDIDLG